MDIGIGRQSCYSEVTDLIHHSCLTVRTDDLSLLHFSEPYLCPSYDVPPSTLPQALYPDWAHDHWVWLSSDQANQEAELALVQGYLQRNVPVGGVDIDSAWSTGINNFIWNEKYPNASAMIDTFHSWGVRVICWVTSMIDRDSPNFQTAWDNNYMVSRGATVQWWHGEGGFLDYTNPYALSWWHSQMDYLLDIGLDGWKCDGTDPYIGELVVPIGWNNTVITMHEYGNMYYGDFFNYTRTKNPEGLIMSRPVDSFDNVIYYDFSPKYVMFAGWVGDQDPTFEGLQDALANMFQSAWANYTNFGSDIGGYRCCGSGVPLGRTAELLLRWAQMGAFNSLMENGGDNEHRPWMFDDTNATLNIYRFFVNIHMELKPYLLTAGSDAYEAGISVMAPLTPKALFPSSWQYMLWHDIFVSPIMQNASLQPIQTISFPNGSNWVDWYNSSLVYTGGTTIKRVYPLEQFPVFHQAGSLLPLYVSVEDIGHGFASSKDALTLLLPYASTKGDATHVRLWKGASQEFSYTYDGNELVFTATAHARPLILLIRGSNLAATASLVNCITSKPLAAISSPPLTLPTADVYYQHHSGDVYVYMRTDIGKKLCVSGLQTPLWSSSS